MTGPVHFILLGGELRWPHIRAMYTAQKTHGPVWLHTAEPVPEFILPSLWPSDLHFSVEVRRLNLPGWLRDHPIKLANVKDLYAYRILHEHGGMYLDFDTISLRPAWDLLTADVCVSREVPVGDPAEHPYNSAVMIAKKGAPVLEGMADGAFWRLKRGESTWGAVGPHLLTGFVMDYPEDFSIAPYRALNGWSYYTIGDYYNRPRDPGGDVRVIHLYSSDNLDSFLTDKWMP